MPAPTLAVVKSPVYKHKTLIISFLSLTKQQQQQQHKKPQNNDKKQTNKKHSPKTPKTPTKNKQQKQVTNKNNNLITTTNRTTNYHFTTLNKRERERNVLFNDALNTFYLRLYGVRHMVKDHSDSEKGNPLPPHRLLLSINSKGYFICTIPQTG